MSVVVVIPAGPESEAVGVSQNGGAQAWGHARVKRACDLRPPRIACWASVTVVPLWLNWWVDRPPWSKLRSWVPRAGLPRWAQLTKPAWLHEKRHRLAPYGLNQRSWLTRGTTLGRFFPTTF